jgi:polar amino acid transport system substrate-binding protein
VPSSRLAVLLSTIALALVVGACGGDDDESTGSAGGAAAPAADACSTDRLALKEPGTLTIGTDKPAFPPYFEDDDPTNGKGFESAVAYAVAAELGFANDQVKWITVPFNSSYAPGPKQFDFDINQISITPQRAERVDFSDPYFTAPQAVVALKGSEAANASDLASLKDAKLGVQVGTTSLEAVQSSIEPNSDPQVFNDSNDTVRALKTERVEAIVVDLPTAFFLTAAQIPEATIVGQFAAPGGDDWGLLLEKGSALTPCVNQALEELRSRGTLQDLQDRYMGGEAAPELN